MTFGVKSSVGCIRQFNQDFYHVPLAGGAPLFMVADGMGGTKGGEIASTLTVSTVSTFVNDNFPGCEDYPLLLRSAVNEANKAVFRTGRMNSELSRMGTTCTAAIIAEDMVYIAQVGDSRCYIMDKDGLRQVTTDHSYVQELVRAGEITPEMARTHPERHKITRAVGINGFVSADVYMAAFEPGTTVMLCSDGLTSMLEDTVIAEELKQLDPQQAADSLVRRAEAAGGFDNITVIVIRND